MESSLTLATESFSYSWLSSSTCKSTTTTPLDPNCHNFNFDISFLTNPSPNSSSCVVAYADELFSAGTIKPLFVLHPNNNTKLVDSLDKTINKPTSSSSSNSRDLRSPIHHHNHDELFTRWKASTRRTFKNISRRIGLLSRKVVCSGKIVSVIDDDIDIDNHNNKNKESQVKRSSITVHPVIGAFHDSHLENSIHEAVLHCKRSKIEEKKNWTSFNLLETCQAEGFIHDILS
ncbi:uncharacterized protein LOC130970703 isoform X1 [Arachis stenosperma]|uniref:uncharacterized protein LOC130970703 isoform X1 n=1 Tax=Arachis stenosperma TaxID=217475 RepID=UPI0025AD8F6A|nr:uncharacterized protein LOC130970703 isoform X1 [Arachis stenosperma]